MNCRHNRACTGGDCDTCGERYRALAYDRHTKTNSVIEVRFTDETYGGSIHLRVGTLMNKTVLVRLIGRVGYDRAMELLGKRMTWYLSRGLGKFNPKEAVAA